MNDWIALVITFLSALIWLRINNFVAHRGWIPSDISRKIIHMGTGPIFVLCWLLFSDSFFARFLAALVPFAITIQFFLVGKGMMKDQSAIDSMSRTGNPTEILRGPLYYGIMFVLLTLLFWKDSPVGIIALMLLCGGDGLADIIGRRVKSQKLPWSERKTILGSVSVFIGGWIMAVGVLLAYSASGVFPLGFAILSWKVALIALAGALVESLPFRDIDNITVPIVAVIAGYFLFI